MDYIFLTVIILFCLGLYAVLTEDNLVKMIIGLNISESALILLLVLAGYKQGGTAPILNREYQVVVDPVPQALALTAIVIGASITALMLFLTIKLYREYGTIQASQIRRLWG